MNIIVLGMHRSGTSLLVGLLEAFGYSLGKVSNKKSKLKPTGTKENIELRKINNQILNFNHQSWDIPSTKLAYNKPIQSNMISFANELPENKWAIKDPRLVLCYNLWIKHLPNHRLISTIRHPLLVARSLKVKNNLQRQRALEIWQVYNQALLNLWEKKPFPILNFDLSTSKYLENLIELEPYLKAKIKPEIFNAFYKHKEQKTLSKCLDAYLEISNLYEKLLTISSRKNNYE